MFKALSIQNIVKGNTAAGVEVDMLPEGGFRMNYVLLKKKKGNLNIVFSGSEVIDLDALKTSINSEVPLCIAITGKGIISKKTTLSENENENSLLHKALPNAAPEDFYLQKTEIANNQAIISVIRKSIIDDLLSQFKNAGFFVVDVSFGPLALTAIIPLINISNGERVNLNGHILQINNSEINDYVYEKKQETTQVEIGGERMNERCAIAFASGFGYFISKEDTITVPEVTAQKNEFKHKRIFQTAGWALLVFFFSLLLLNFFLFSHYNSRAAELKVKVDKNKDDLASIATLQNELKLKQKLLDRLGVMESSKISLYADRIASGLPKEIRLTEMFIHPVDKNVNAGKKELDFVPKIINISGQCKQSSELNDWVKVLKENDWIKSVNVLNYTQENPNESGVFQIQIGIL